MNLVDAHKLIIEKKEKERKKFGRIGDDVQMVIMQPDGERRVIGTFQSIEANIQRDTAPIHEIGRWPIEATLQVNNADIRAFDQLFNGETRTLPIDPGRTNR